MNVDGSVIYSAGAHRQQSWPPWNFIQLWNGDVNISDLTAVSILWENIWFVMNMFLMSWMSNLGKSRAGPEECKLKSSQILACLQDFPPVWKLSLVSRKYKKTVQIITHCFESKMPAIIKYAPNREKSKCDKTWVLELMTFGDH